jgi:1,4-alpha-glucan branching enzyme
VWLDAVIEEAGRRGLALSTLPAALARHQPREADVAESSWGTGKDLHTWDSPAVADLVWTARESELQLIGALAAPQPDGHGPAAPRAARELLALQSSDWAFMRARGLAGEYPSERVRNHSAAFGRALAVLVASVKDSRAMNGGRPQPSSEESGTRLDERVRGLAPQLDLSPLIASTPPWPRER